MRRLAAVLLVLTACGGGDVTSPEIAGSPTPTVSTPDAPAPSVTVSPVARHGSAKVTFGGKAFAWPERACETTRGTDGAVVGWMATFQDIEEQQRQYRTGITDSRLYVQIRLRGYTGAGTYPSERVSVRLGELGATPALQTGFGVPGQRLVLRDGGRSGRYEHRDLTVEFDCDPADDTSTEGGQAVGATPSPGEAYVVRPEGAVFRFDGVRCAKRGADTEVYAGAFPHFFRLLAGGSGGGRVLFAVHGVVVPFAEVRVEGDPGTSGTFRYSPSGPNATTGVTRAAFACG